MLFIHGVAAHGAVFQAIGSLLREFSVLAIDLRGHGLSPTVPPWNIATHVADLLRFLDKAGIDRCPVVGHSYGGRIAMELASSHPERVEKLVLLEPAIWLPPERASELARHFGRPQSWDSIDAAVESRRAMSPVVPEAYDSLREEVALMLEVDGDGYFRPLYTPGAAVTACSEIVYPATFPRVSALLVRGDRSALVTDDLVLLYQEAVGDCVRAIMLPGYHDLHLDALELLVGEMTTFLGRRRLASPAA